jgi:hypothetical protein
MTVSPSPEQLSELVLPSKSELISQIAPVIFEAMRWAARNAEKGSPPPWVNGNSLAEDRAREAAELLLAQAGTADALESAQAEIARLTTALEFYAYGIGYTEIEDGGEIARAALKDSPNVG